MTGVKEKKARVGGLDPPIPFAGEERIGSAMRNKNPASLLLNVAILNETSAVTFATADLMGTLFDDRGHVKRRARVVVKFSY